MIHRAFLALIVLCIITSLLTSPVSAADAKRPNIIVFVADDLGYADIGAQGISKDVKTPNIDAIFTAGTRFTNGYVSCPVCSPTRAGLMTGRYQQRFGHEVNPGPNEAATFGLPLDQITLPQALKAAGYSTGMVGKWHLGFKPEMHPMKRGFDSFFGFLAGAHGYNMVGQDKNVLMRGATPLESTDYLTDAFSREAVEFVHHHAEADKPFFLYLAFNAVHTPQQAPKKYLDRFPDVKDEKRKLMLAMLSAMDDAVGAVMAEVVEEGAGDNTLVFFITDNGGPTAGNGSLNTPLRGFKGQTYEGGIRVPFAMAWKGHVPEGKVYDKQAISLDIFPTALTAAGATPPEGVKLDGIDLLPFLTGKDNATPHPTLFWRFGPQWAIRDGNFKLLKSGAEGVQLFDLATDISEKSNLAAEKPDVAKQLQAKYDAWSATMAKPLWQDTRDAKPGARRRAKAGATQQSGGGDD